MSFLISTDPTNISFSRVLKSFANKDIFMVEDKSWLIFLKDHELLMKAHSTYKALDKETMYRYRYRLREYIDQECGLDPSMIMPIRIVNRLFTRYDFNEDTEGIYIPDPKYVTNLRDTYATNISIQKQL